MKRKCQTDNRQVMRGREGERKREREGLVAELNHAKTVCAGDKRVYSIEDLDVDADGHCSISVKQGFNIT